MTTFGQGFNFEPNVVQFARNNGLRDMKYLLKVFDTFPKNVCHQIEKIQNGQSNQTTDTSCILGVEGFGFVECYTLKKSLDEITFYQISMNKAIKLLNVENSFHST